MRMWDEWHEGVRSLEAEEINLGLLSSTNLRQLEQNRICGRFRALWREKAPPTPLSWRLHSGHLRLECVLRTLGGS